MTNLLPHPTEPITPVNWPAGKCAVILFSEFSGDPGYLAERFLTLYSAGVAVTSVNALFSSSGLTDFLVSESSGRRRTSSIRLGWSQI